MKGLRYLVILFLLFSVKPLASQTQTSDVIITKKGEHINCSVTRTDTARVFFKVGGNVSSIEVSLPLSEVSEIKYMPKAIPVTTPSAQTQKDDYVPANSSTVNPDTKKMEAPHKSNCLTFFGGLASPQGKFSDSNLDTNEIGPAMLGQVGMLTFTHRAKNGLMAGLNCFFSVNQLNTTPITDKYAYHTDSIWVADKASWRAFGIHLSVGYHKIFSEDVSVYAKINAGYISLKYPEVTLSVSNKQYFKFNTATADAISYGAAAGINYRLFEGLGAALEVSYIQSNCKYNEVLVQGESPATPVNKKISRTLRDIEQPYRNIFICLGVNYWF